MPQAIDLREEVLRAYVSLPLKDKLNINLDLAQEVAKTALDKLERVHDRGSVIRYALSERHIGNEGTREKRQRTFGAYWRFTRRIMDNRERRTRPTKRKKREAV